MPYRAAFRRAVKNAYLGPVTRSTLAAVLRGARSYANYSRARRAIKFRFLQNYLPRPDKVPTYRIYGKARPGRKTAFGRRDIYYPITKYDEKYSQLEISNELGRKIIKNKRFGKKMYLPPKSAATGLDRRRWDPVRYKIPYQMTKSGAVAKLGGLEKAFYVTKALPRSIKYYAEAPNKLWECIKRRMRKEVMHASKKAGKTGQRVPHWKYESYIIC